MKLIILKKITVVSSLFSLVTGVIVLIGWHLSVPSFIRVLPGLVAMNPVTAICFIFSATWILLSQREKKKGVNYALPLYILSISVLCIGLMKASDLLFHSGIAVDKFLYRRELMGSEMHPCTVFNFTLIGLLTLTSTIDNVRFRTLNNYLLGIPLFVTLLALCVYLMEDISGTTFEASMMALHSCISFLFLLLALLSLHVKYEFILNLLSKKLGGISIAVLVPASILFVITIALLRNQAEQMGLIGRAVGVSFMAVFSISFVLFIFYQSAIAQSKVERQGGKLQIRVQKAKQIAENANDDRARFMSNMNHELRTPLNGILGFTHILMDASVPMSEQQEYLDHIRSSGMILSKRIDEMLNEKKQSYSSTGHVRVQKTTTNLSFLTQHKLLIVEDNIINQELVKFILKKNGYEFYIASNGREAIDLLRNHHFDIVFMDLDMPIMDGYEATRQIRTSLRLDIPIVALTASLAADDIEQCMSAGMNGHLAKPYTETQLLNIIYQFLADRGN